MRRLLAGALLVLALFLLVGTLAFLARGEAGAGLGRQTATVDRTLGIASVPTVTIDNRNGEIVITRGDEGVVGIHAVKRAASQALLDTIHVEIAQAGDRVSVKTTYDRPSFWHLLGGASRSVSYEIRLPARATVASARSSNGAIQVSGVAGRLDLETSNGAIAVRDPDGDVKARTSNGRIGVTGGSGSLALSTSNGAIEIQDLRASGLVVETSNGRIAFTGALAPGSRSQLTTSNGRVTLTLPPDLSASVDLKTSNGAIDVGYPLTTQPVDGNTNARSSVRGTIGSEAGTGTQIVVRTSNGAITIARQGD